ncbi:MAG: VWA domain-containing protein [Acidobacteriota bacterium]
MSPLAESFPVLADPAWLALLLLAPILAWRHHRRPGHGALTYSRLPRDARGRTGHGRWRLHLPFYLRLAAFVLVTVALARPQIGHAWEESLTEGIDIQIALDVSGSMGAEDFQPKDRLTVAKEVVKDFVSGRTGDRIGLVAFSGGALTKAPLTSDRRMLHFLVDSLKLGELPRGTAIGVALATAAARMEHSEAESRVIVLVTDGINNTGEVDPASAAALCDSLGIKVYTIGVGTRRKVPIPVARQSADGSRTVGRVIRSLPVDEALLAEIAERTGGRFYLATDHRALASVFDEIDRLETTELEVKRFVRYEEAFRPLVWAALALALAPLLTTTLQWTAEA